ncbi:Nitroreductase family protein [Halogranum amylolyticum]|uniref:Nitroreductase family protein n=1 Tax=Halogranum amylolyticum TaxID=660520 RepID=A0A1H8UL23_9EURY|nr:nitroreductase family protein [Halogranum amylolyticum]SEP03871.1 Nitroreductase family protein [Halogranum amylolyticum]
METDELTHSVWDITEDEFPVASPLREQGKFLLRYAILAPSSHNSQPWQFAVRDETIEVTYDETRWLEVADQDKRELFISIGCALENLCIAAEHFDIGYNITYHANKDDNLVSIVTLETESEPSFSRPPKLFDELTERYTSHQLFEDQTISQETRDKFSRTIEEDDVTLYLINESEQKRSIGELQADADEAQMADPAYRKELGYWVGMGALGSSWLMARIGQAVVTHFDLGEREGQNNSKLIERAPVIAVLATHADTPTARVKAGQVFERLALLASAEDIAVHPMSQTLERPEMRTELAARADTEGEYPQHLFRLGYVEEERTHTPRWPLESQLS